MRQALRTKSPRAPVVSVYSQPAPIGGLNTRDALAAMPETDAKKLINWYPTTTECVLRGGYSAHATTITGTVETLAVYNKMNGSNQMFAVTDTDVYNVSSAGVATAQSATITDGKCQYTNFGDGTTNWLIMVNGVNKPLYWSGSTWTSVDSGSTPAITGVTTTNLIHVTEHKGRLYFIEKNSLSFWYLPAQAAGGAAIEFDLSSYASEGGYLMWASTWSFDGGDGPDDAIVFMTSEGEIIVYRGTDPSTSANWALVGVYFLGKPLGRRSYAKFGGDLIAITDGGVFPMSSALQSATVDNRVAFTNKIESTFIDDARRYGSNFGWEATLYPLQNAMIFNVPIKVGGTKKQYVMNTITKSWCEFDSWNGECFAVYNGNLYFGGNTVVQKAWSGTSDNGSEITAIGKTAFNYFGTTSQQKRFNFFRPMLNVNATLVFNTGMDVDFTDRTISGTSTYTQGSTDVWDTAVWDAAKWYGSASGSVIRQWTSPSNNVGYCASGGIKINVKGIEVSWQSNDFVYESGGIL